MNNFTQKMPKLQKGDRTTVWEGLDHVTRVHGRVTYRHTCVIEVHVCMSRMSNSLAPCDEFQN